MIALGVAKQLLVGMLHTRDVSGLAEHVSLGMREETDAVSLIMPERAGQC